MMRKFNFFLKRLFDLLGSGIGLLLLSPIFLLASVMIKLTMPGPVFFHQTRVGKDGRLFDILKFRSMSTKAPADMPTHLLSNPDAYLTRWQKFIRKSSIDELPQMFNILGGSMSIIGPRPALWNQEDLICARDKYGANDIRPGLTGWAQINGRDELKIPVKAKLDGEYVEKMSFGFDCKCFFGTIKSVLKHDGVVEGGTGELNSEKERAERNEPANK